MKWCNSLRSGKLALAIAIFSLFGCQSSRYITPPTQAINATLNSSSAEGHGRLSHDGRYLIYHSDRLNSQRSIFLYDLQRRRLVPLPGLNQPGSMQYQADLSSDGRNMVYVSEQLGKTDIFLYNRLTGKSQNLTKNFIGEVRNPSISGNGRFVCFESNRSGQWDIEIYDRGVGIDFSQPGNIYNVPDTSSPPG
ncbi:PD40 domain-containing protein [Waterburya agarophytonicola K14]|uniref:PD40 domain-containing protein n=2 Tax=Waterburya TaxID=2886915 RepID=A0A964BLU1_9CYAN|nr:PD40 domain-containing protein [Waterburya agarophytonicola KI4]